MKRKKTEVPQLIQSMLYNFPLSFIQENKQSLI